jgi:glycosyltransferase involved in cell wall biosynthesis
MPTLAWFSPMPPDPSGIAGRSAELVAALRARYDIQVFDSRTAHDFLWRHRRTPFDLTVYQLGNSSLHDFIWPYLFRFPGLAVLHDAQLHHARASTLLRQRRPDDYRAEFGANHPEASKDLAELAIRGFDTHLYYMWPMTRLVAQASRLTALHARALADRLSADVPDARLTSIRLGEGVAMTDAEKRDARREVRTRHGIPDDAIVFGVFGGLTPEKRISEVLAAFAAVIPYRPDARLLLVGKPASHYSVHAAIAANGLDAQVIVTGYVEEDAFTAHLAATDVSINLRWPTAREMSGPWLRALAAGVPTITTDLMHLADVPSFDPRTWSVAHTFGEGDTPEPVSVSIDLLDEAHSLRLAMRRLASDASLRERIARAGHTFWEREHRFERMVADYQQVIERAMQTPAPAVHLPPHLVHSGEERLAEILGALGLRQNLWSTI